MDAEAVYLFAHAVLRDAVYQLMLPGDRAALHGELVQAADAQAVELPPLELARHAHAAQEDAADPGPMRAREMHWLRLAVDECAARSDFETQRSLLERLVALHHGSPAEFETQLLLAEVSRETGHLDRAEHALQRASGISGPEPDKQRRLRRAMVGLFIRSARLSQAEEIEMEVLHAARASGDQVAMQEALSSLGVIHYHLGRYDEAQPNYRQARRLAARQGNLSAAARTTGNLALMLGELGLTAEAEALHRDALRLADRAQDRLVTGNVLGNLALLLTDSQRFEDAEPMFRRALEHEARIGHRPGYAIALANLGRMLRMSGRTEEAEPILKQAAELHREVAATRNEGTTLGQLADMLAELGRFEEALVNFDRGLELVRAAQDRLYTGVLLGARGRLRLRLGDRPGAEQDLHDTEEALAHAPESFREHCLYPLREALA